MGSDLQNAIDEDNLAEARNNLLEFTGKIKISNNGVNKPDNKYIDEMQLGFIVANPDLTFEELLVIKRFADYMKSR